MDGNGAQFVRRLWVGLDLGKAVSLKPVKRLIGRLTSERLVRSVHLFVSVQLHYGVKYCVNKLWTMCLWNSFQPFQPWFQPIDDRPPTLRKKITPENWVIASAKSVLLSRVLLLKKNGYFYPNRVPIPEYSGFVDTVRYFFYSGFLVSATPFFRVHSFVGYNYTNISGLATLLQV